MTTDLKVGDKLYRINGMEIEVVTITRVTPQRYYTDLSRKYYSRDHFIYKNYIGSQFHATPTNALSHEIEREVGYIEKTEDRLRESRERITHLKQLLEGVSL